MMKVSVIIPSFNAGHCLEKAILSVVNQNYALLELIIIDGGSTDHTIDIIKKYKDHIHAWISEKDKGIYEAMNKGIDKATGEWLFFLGADDQLENLVFKKIEKELVPNCKVVFGKVIFQNGIVMTSNLSVRTLLQNTIHHQSAFYHKSLFDQFRYDTGLKAIADYELNLKIWLDKLPCKKIDSIIACCYADGTSSNFNLSLEETNRVRKKLISSSLLQEVLSGLLRLYYYQKRLRGISLTGYPVKKDG